MPDDGARPAEWPGGSPSADVIQPFHLEAGRRNGAALSGRMVRMGALIDDVMRRQDYPEPVAVLLGEGLALTATLAGALKFDGIFTLQIQGDGPVSLLVADVATGDGGESFELRGYAKFDAERLDELESASAAEMFGKGYLALTVDQGSHTDRYQGMVELVGDNLAEFAQHYFRQSQQMDAAIMLSAGRDSGAWRAAGIMLQRVADTEQEILSSDDGDDPWRRAMMLMATGTREEMLDPGLAPARYLYRLFHQEGLRISDPRKLARGCRCSSERILNVLRRLPPDDIAHLAEEGDIEVTCEFCAEVYIFDPQTLEPR